MRQTQLGLTLIFLLVMSSIAWAGKEAYTLAMSKDKELCETMLELFNSDTKKYREIRYQEHESFSKVPWEKIGVPSRLAPSCQILQKAMFDINNDGRDELVIKLSACIHGQLVDSLYLFPLTSDILSKLKPDQPGGLSDLFTATDKVYQTGEVYALSELNSANTDGLKMVTGIVKVNPLMWKKTTYLSITDLYPEWIVVAKYLQQEVFEDFCYLHAPSLKRP